MAGGAKRVKIDLDALESNYVEPEEEYEDLDDEGDVVFPFNHSLDGQDLITHTDTVRELFSDEQEALQEDNKLPYTDDEGWPWVVGEFKPGHIPLITAVLTVLFGVYMKHCVGWINPDGDFVPSELFLPLGIQGKSAGDRAKTPPCYANPHNLRVYKEAKSPISFFVVAFVNLLKDLGYFTASDGDYFAPPHLFDFAVQRIELKLLGDQNTSAQPTAGLEARLGHGIRQIQMPKRRQWGVNDQILIVPDPKERQDWDRDIYLRGRRPGESVAEYNAAIAQKKISRRGHIAQLHLVHSDVDIIPCIPSGRHFTDVHMESFERLFRIVNGAVTMFVKLKDKKTTDNELQQWVSTLTVDLVHEYCPNFMSYVGAQYLQRICVKHQADTDRDKRPGAPRAYFSRKVTTRMVGGVQETYLVYRDEMTPNEDRLVASFFEVFGSMFYSIKTYISAFVGEGGTGKNFIRRAAVKIAGGLKHTFRVEPSHHKFSLSMLHPWTFLLIGEDASDAQLEIPKTFMDSAIGSTRGVRADGGVVEAKYGTPNQELVEPLGMCYMRNDPTDEGKGLVGKSRLEKTIACVQGMTGGKDRRVRLAGPLMVRLTEGPVNPTDDHNDLAFDPTKTDQEIPFLKLILWMTTTLGDLVRDDLYGLTGEGGIPELDELLKSYLAMGTTNVGENIRRIIQPCVEKTFKCEIHEARTVKYTIRCSYAISFKDIKTRYHKMFKATLKTLPDDFEQLRQRMLMCRDCGLTIQGVKQNLDALLPKIHQACTDPDKGVLIGSCTGDVPCYKKLYAGSKVLYNHRLMGDPVTGDTGSE